ncbi:MAG TPA: helix-turn-helix domain-containing protein [Trebonia sp.]|nr:helix-turn-helix domain-containing protein [Trebonia sp.]
MRASAHPETASGIISAVRPRLPELVDRITARIRREIPFYTATDVVRADDLRESVRANVDYILDSLAGSAMANLSAPHATGRARAAQGAPLAEMLTAYRVGVAEIWSTLVATARGLPGVSADHVIDLADAVFAAQNVYSDAALAAYRDESIQMLRTRERERAALVEVILTGVHARGAHGPDGDAGAAAAGSTAGDTLWEVAQTLRLPLDGTFLVIAAEASPGHDPLPGVEGALAVADIRSVWRLDAEVCLGIACLPDRSRNETALAILNRRASGRIGASPVFAELRQASWALQLARLALGSHPGGSGVEQFRDSPIDMLVAAAPQAALGTARAVLGGLLELPKDELDLLLGTFEVWVRASGSATAAGAALYCHPNTVRYRLRRIEAGTGRTLSSPGDIAELVTAVRAWSELPHQ